MSKPKSDKPIERVRVSVKDGGAGEPFLDVRVCYLDSNYKFSPTRKGFSIPVSEAGALIESLESVRAYALYA